MEPASRRPQLLRTYLPIVIVVTLLTMTGTGLGALLGPKHYVSTTEVVVGPESIGGGAPVAPTMGTEKSTALSGDVRDLAAAALGVNPPEKASAGLSVSVPVDTTVLRFSYSADNAAAARHRVQVFTDAYVAYRNRETASAESGGASAPPTGSDGPEVANQISRPSKPSLVEPNYPLLLGVALLVGIAVGIGCAYVWDRLSGRLRGARDIEWQTGLPVLGSLPSLDTAALDEPGVLTGYAPPGAEAFGHLAAHVLHRLDANKAGTLLVTSPSKGSGTTMVAVTLASSFAAVGRRVILVSAEVGDPATRQYLGFNRRPGLRDVLRGTSSLAQAVHPTSVPGLQVLTAGSPARLDEPLLNVDDFDRLLQRLVVSDVLVIIDSPAVIGSPETACIADQVDALILVVDARHGSRSGAASAVSLLSHVRDSILGVVSNDPGRHGRSRRSAEGSAALSLAPEPEATATSRESEPVEPARGS